MKENHEYNTNMEKIINGPNRSLGGPKFWGLEY